MEIIGMVVALVVGAVVGVLIGRSGGSGDEAESAARAQAQRTNERWKALAATVRSGRLPDGGAAGSAEAALRSALEAAWTPRGQERQKALEDAVGRVSTFLDTQVRAPLAGASPGADAEELRERIEQALGSLIDLEFFLEEPGTERQGQNLSALVQRVTREFAQDQEILVRLKMSGPVRAEVNAESLMDALYLLLHNAGRFGEGQAVEVTVQDVGGPVIQIEDQGSGFTDDALARAFDPFYSTADDGLGLGLPHARRALESMGGTLELSNVPGGGARVEIRFPEGRAAPA